MAAYCNSEHFAKAFAVFNVMQKANFLCDVVLLTTNQQEFPAHKAVLASCSPYFHAMFDRFDESHQERIVLQNIDPKALGLLLDYIYSSEIQINEEDAQILLPAANHLQIVDVKDACAGFLVTKLHPSNCLGIRRFADLHCCVDLVTSADKYTAQHFCDVVNGEEFAGLNCQEVTRLISSDNLNVLSEEKVYEAVMKWVNVNSNDRISDLPQLMENVRLPLISKEYLLQHVVANALIRSNAQCTNLLFEALKYHLLEPEEKLIYNSPRTRPRLPPKILLVVGGRNQNAFHREVECYDFETERWRSLADMPTGRSSAGLAYVNGRVYAIGGYDGTTRVRTVDFYDPNLNRWFPAPAMKTVRSAFGVAVLNNFIFAVGGNDGSTGFGTVERYDPSTEEWRPVAPMSTQRNGVGVGVLNGLLYAVGGYDGASRQCLSSVEFYSPETDTWTPVREMTNRRSGAGVGVLNGFLYVIGGYDDTMVHRSVERFDPATRTWSPVSDMSNCRKFAGVATHQGLLYAVGGDDGTTHLSSVEIYNPTANTWSMLPASMNIGRVYGGTTIINRPF